MVRTWRPERNHHVFIVLNCGRARPAAAPRLDAAIESTLLLTALSAIRAGDQVDVLACDAGEDLFERLGA